MTDDTGSRAGGERLTWSDAAKQFADLADKARASGNLVVMAAALVRASECLQIARNLDAARLALSNSERTEG